MSGFITALFEKFTAFILSVLSLFNLFADETGIKETVTDVNGSLVCTDELGRSVITAGESEKLVGVFYFLWHSQHGSDRIIDNTKLVK